MANKINRKKALESIDAFLSNNDIVTIIKICHLYPTKSWKRWHDLMGNHINIISKNNIKFISNSLDNHKQIITDLYYKSQPNIISKKSKWAFISFGKGNNNIDISFIWFLGKDDRLRLLSISDDKWNENQPPLSCGLNTLRPIIKNLDVKSYKKVDILRIGGPDAAKIIRSWATIWPPDSDLKNEMLSFNYNLSKKIIQDCEV